jgi:hypothetical protein
MSTQSTLKLAVKEAGWIFLISRFAILVLTYLAMSILPDNGHLLITNCFTAPRTCILSWMHYDVLAYIDIAMHGYTRAAATAFFPLWPLLLHSLGFLAGGSVTRYYLLGIILANILFYLALVILYLLSYELFDHAVAEKALLYLAFAPFALFFFIGYTEALFLLLCLATFLFLQRGSKYSGWRNWLLAGICGFLASLTRSQGFLLVLPYVIVFASRYILAGKLYLTSWREKILSLAPIVLMPAGVGVYMLYLWHTKGDPFLFSQVESKDWGRTSSFPWVGIYYAVKALFVPTTLQALNAINLVSVIVPLIILAIGWRRIPVHYSLFALLLIVFTLCYPLGTANALTSIPRYMLVVFPATIIAASWKNRKLETLFIILSLSIFTLNVILFVHHYWVA